MTKRANVDLTGYKLFRTRAFYLCEVCGHLVPQGKMAWRRVNKHGLTTTVICRRCGE